jgi:hypothetical protein
VDDDRHLLRTVSRHGQMRRFSAPIQSARIRRIFVILLNLLKQMTIEVLE